MPLFEIVSINTLKGLFLESPYKKRKWEGIGNTLLWLIIVTFRNRSPICKLQKRVFGHIAILENPTIFGFKMYQIRDNFGGN